MLIDIVKKINKFEPDIREVLLDILNEVETQRKQHEQTVTKIEFNELKEIVKELAEAQRKTEERMESLEKKIEELTEAQKRTEIKLKELAEAQKKTEERMHSLEQKMEELAEAQRKTEERMNSLEKKMEKLAEAQRKTEVVVKDMKIRLEGLSDTVGYGLEDKLIPVMPKFIKNKYGFEVKLVDRRNLVYPDGKFDEINIYIEAKDNNQDLIIIGECKAKPGKRDINRFLKLKQRVEKFTDKNVIAFIIGYSFHPEVEEYLNKIDNLDFYKTFEIERIAT